MDSYSFAKNILRVARKIQSSSVPPLPILPSEATPSLDQPVLPNSLFLNTRGYLEKIVYQINRCYIGTSYDACAVMVRRLIEVLIIEAFEHHKLSRNIIDSDGNYYRLDELVRITLAENTWVLGRNTKAALRKLKTIGDQSAHSRRYNARREYIDDIIIDLRVLAEEFLYISGLNK